MKKILIGLVAFAVIAGVAFVIHNNVAAPTASIATPALQDSNFSWKIEHLSEDSTSPTDKVSLVVGGSVNKTFPVDTYKFLACSEQTSFEKDPNEIAQVICWHGGGGYEIGVFKEGNSYIVKQGGIDEGDAETPGSRSDFKTLFEIK